MDNKAKAEIIRKAADLIDQRGLAKGVYIDEHRCLCIFGALNEIEYGDANSGSSKIPTYIYDALFAEGINDISITDFNDTHTKEEVIAEMKIWADKVEAMQ